MAAIAVAGPAFVVIQVLSVGVPFRDTIQALCLADVPAHEIQRIVEIVAAGEPAAGVALIVIPGFVLGLRIAIGGADPSPRDESEQIVARWQGILAKAGLLVHHGHGHLWRYTPFVAHFQGGLMPLRLFAEYRAQVFRIGRWQSGAAAKRQ